MRLGGNSCTITSLIKFLISTSLLSFENGTEWCQWAGCRNLGYNVGQCEEWFDG